MTHWTEWRPPDAYSDEEQETILIPTRSAATEEEAFEHLLADVTDWTWREKQRDEVRADYQYEGIHDAKVCDRHETGDRHERDESCLTTLPAHRFTLRAS